MRHAHWYDHHLLLPLDDDESPGEASAHGSRMSRGVGESCYMESWANHGHLETAHTACHVDIDSQSPPARLIPSCSSTGGGAGGDGPPRFEDRFSSHPPCGHAHPHEEFF